VIFCLTIGEILGIFFSSTINKEFRYVSD